MDYMGDRSVLVEIQETDVYYLSLPREQTLYVTGVSHVQDWACTGFASGTNTWALNFQGNDSCLPQCKSFIVFGFWVHMPMNWWGRLFNEEMEGLLGGESWHPDDNAVSGVQGKCVCIKINYSLLWCIVFCPNRANWSVELPNISRCWDGSSSAVWNEYSVLTENNCSFLFSCFELVLVFQILHFVMKLYGVLSSWEADMEKLDHIWMQSEGGMCAAATWLLLWNFVYRLQQIHSRNQKRGREK